MDPRTTRDLARAAESIRNADALLIGAGAGMGVDSGLPDFRGNQGFWNAYPLYGQLGFSFAQLANPRWFYDDPQFAWGFYGHRLNLYRTTQPHDGFAILKRWSESRPLGSFVFTSNVDGQFQRAGFDADRIVECHGAIDRLQCFKDCGKDIFTADAFEIEVSPETFRAVDPLPNCPRCGGLARPNLLMFGDSGWDDLIARRQEGALSRWLGQLQGARVALVELGAGTAIPSVRHLCESVASASGGTLIRINVREHETQSEHIGLPIGALKALREIDARL